MGSLRLPAAGNSDAGHRTAVGLFTLCDGQQPEGERGHSVAHCSPTPGAYPVLETKRKAPANCLAPCLGGRGGMAPLQHIASHGFSLRA